MTKIQEELAEAVKMIAWGYVLLHLNFYLGTLNILPTWLGYIFILRALPMIDDAEPTALLLRPIGIALALWEGVLWILALFSISFNGNLLGIVIAVLSLYFHFQLLTNLAGIAERYDCPEQKRILTLRTVRTILITLFALPIAWEQYEALTFFVIAVHIIIAIWICSLLFSLRSSLLSKESGIIEQ